MKQPTPQFTPQPSYTYEELIACAEGKMFGKGNAKLPLPPMLMFDRITKISSDGGKFNKGEIIAEMDISEDNWFFKCHFVEDPVMPGCLGLDAMWQLIGFYLGWSGGLGKGRALGVGNLKFQGQVTPDIQHITYQIDIKRVLMRDVSLGIADANLLANNQVIYTAQNLRVGLFQNIDKIMG